MEVAGRRRVVKGDINTSPFCDPCLSEDEQTDAEFYCYQCDEFLCVVCARVNRKSKLLKHHRLLDKTEMPKRKLGSLVDRLCSKHKGKMIKFYCNKHECCCCSVCVTLEHNQCGAIYIDDVAMDYIDSQEYRDVIQSINNLEKHILDSSQTSQNTSDTAEKYYSTLVDDVRQFKMEINAKLDALENKVKMEAEQIKSEDLKAAKSRSVFYKDTGADLTQLTSTLRALESFKFSQQLFISTKKAQIKIRKMQDEFNYWAHTDTLRRYIFQQNDSIMKTLNSLSALGTLRVQYNIDKQADVQYNITRCTSVPLQNMLEEENENRAEVHTANSRDEGTRLRYGLTKKQLDELNPKKKPLKTVKLGKWRGGQAHDQHVARKRDM